MTIYVVLVVADEFLEKYEAGDALVWAELYHHPIRVPFRALNDPIVHLPNRTITEDLPSDLIVTSPNMDFIPALRYDLSDVWIRADGRYGVHDFTLYPQWYFEGTYYLPFIPRKPPADVLKDHEYALAWYDPRPEDFRLEGRGEGGEVEVGRFRQDLVDAFLVMRKKLSEKVDDLAHELKPQPGELNEMRHSQRGMIFASVILDCAPQNKIMTLLTATSFQRHFLETLACYTYFKDFVPRKFTGSVEPHPVDKRLMGTLTASLQVAQEMHQLGVPVWLIRRPFAISRFMNVGSEVYLREPEFEMRILAGTVRVHHGGPSAVRNRVCQALRIKSIRIDHSAYKEVQSGDDCAPVAGLMPGI
jgi:hypothetical protein